MKQTGLFCFGHCKYHRRLADSNKVDSEVFENLIFLVATATQTWSGTCQNHRQYYAVPCVPHFLTVNITQLTRVMQARWVGSWSLRLSCSDVLRLGFNSTGVGVYFTFALVMNTVRSHYYNPLHTSLKQIHDTQTQHKVIRYCLRVNTSYHSLLTTYFLTYYRSHN
jgi:hypothetical protein